MKTGDRVKRVDTERVGQVVQVLPGHAAKVQWLSGKEDWLPISLLTRVDSSSAQADGAGE